MAVTVCSATDLNNRAVCSSCDESELWSLALSHNSSVRLGQCPLLVTQVCARQVTDTLHPESSGEVPYVCLTAPCPNFLLLSNVLMLWTVGQCFWNYREPVHSLKVSRILLEMIYFPSYVQHKVSFSCCVQVSNVKLLKYLEVVLLLYYPMHFVQCMECQCSCYHHRALLLLSYLL